MKCIRSLHRILDLCHNGEHHFMFVISHACMIIIHLNQCLQSLLKYIHDEGERVLTIFECRIQCKINSSGIHWTPRLLHLYFEVAESKWQCLLRNELSYIFTWECFGRVLYAYNSIYWDQEVSIWLHIVDVANYNNLVYITLN